MYVVIINDRHSEPFPYLLKDKHKAIAFAVEKAKELNRNREDYVKQDFNGELLTIITYTCEGDCIYVYEVDKESD